MSSCPKCGSASKNDLGACSACAFTDLLLDEIQEKKSRSFKQYLLCSPEDCDPPHGLDLTPGSRDLQKVEWLEEQFRANGFDPNMPALVGYPCNGRIELLSGTHRHEAAKRAGIKLPVAMRLRSTVEAAWGTPLWDKLIEDMLVKDLEKAEVQEGIEVPGLDERVDLSRDVEKE